MENSQNKITNSEVEKMLSIISDNVTLTDDERELVRAVYGLDCDKQSLNDIAESKSMSVCRVYNLKNKVLSKIREEMAKEDYSSAKEGDNNDN